MDVVMLDMDGVLVPFGPDVPSPQVVKVKRNGREFHFARPDHMCVGRLNRIVGETGAAVVLSTSWREPLIRFNEVGLLAAFLRHCGFAGQVVGYTPHGDVAQSKGVRGVEVGAWLRDNGK